MGSTFDPDKDGANIAKHGLSLVEGEGVLSDPLGLTIEDESSEGEPRWITIGANASGPVPFDFSGNGRSGALLYDPSNGQSLDRGL